MYGISTKKIAAKALFLKLLEDLTTVVVVHFAYVWLEILKRSYGIGFAKKKKPPGRKHCLGNIHGMEKHTIGFIVCGTENLFNSTLFQSFKSHSKLNVQLVPNYAKKYLAFPCVWQLIVIFKNSISYGALYKCKLYICLFII